MLLVVRSITFSQWSSHGLCDLIVALVIVEFTESFVRLVGFC